MLQVLRNTLMAPGSFSKVVGHVVGDHIGHALSVSTPSLVFFSKPPRMAGMSLAPRPSIFLPWPWCLAISSINASGLGNFSTGALELCMTPPSVSMEPRMPFSA